MIDLLYEDALMLYQIGNYPLAQKKLEKILQEAPFEENAHFAYASSLQMQKKYPQAIEAWQRVLFLDSKNPQAYFHLAECLISNKDMKGAKETLHAASVFADKTMQDKINQLETRLER